MENKWKSNYITKQAVLSVDRMCGISSLKHGDGTILAKFQSARIWMSRAREAGESATTLQHIENLISFWEEQHAHRVNWGRFIFSQKLNDAIVYLT